MLMRCWKCRWPPSPAWPSEYSTSSSQYEVHSKPFSLHITAQQLQPPRSPPFFLKTTIEVASNSIESVGESRSARASGGQNATASSTSSS
eukprot:COSAG04_NODE_1567_length_6319_cov_7.571543_2_plen_90_part_00